MEKERKWVQSQWQWQCWRNDSACEGGGNTGPIGGETIGPVYNFVTILVMKRVKGDQESID